MEGKGGVGMVREKVKGEGGEWCKVSVGRVRGEWGDGVAAAMAVIGFKVKN